MAGKFDKSGHAVKTAIKTIGLSGSSRRQHYFAPPDNLQLDWAFHDASTTLLAGLQIDEVLCQQANGRQLRPGEVGCYSSHVSIWRGLVENPDLAQIIVLEDDVIADWLVLSQLSTIDWSKLGIDYLKFHYKYPAKFRRVCWDYPIKDRHVVQLTSLALGTTGYLLTKSGARKLEQYCRVVRRPIDLEMDRAWSTKLPVFGLVPAPIIEMSSPTTILGREPLIDTSYRTLRYLAGRLLEHTREKTYPIVAPQVKIDVKKAPPVL